VSTLSRSWLSYAVWVPVGAGYAVGVLGLLTIGLPVLALSLLATGALAVTRLRGKGMVGLVTGLGLPLLFVAYLNRGGPGEVCSTSGGTTECVEAWSPWGWAVAGVALVITGAALFALRRET
jgi:hypothetical protein